MRDWQDSQWPHLSGSEEQDPRNLHVPRPWDTPPESPEASGIGWLVVAVQLGLVVGTVVACYGWLHAHVFRFWGW